MKTCSKCGDEKPIEEFPPRTQRGKAGHQPHCRECARKYVREHYARNRPKMYERAKYFIVSEVAHVKDIDEEKAEKQVEKALETTIQKLMKSIEAE